MVEEFFVRKKLAELGYRFNGESLSDHDAHAFSIIASEISKLDIDQAKKKKTQLRSKVRR